MPFTAAHPVIFLPFLKNKKVSATGLIAGSMAPDFEYFFKMSSGSVHSHTTLGLFYFDLPVCLLISIIFHEVIKVSLFDHLPESIKKKTLIVPDFKFLNYLKSKYLIFLFSGLIGASSHLIWDIFTHNNWIIQRIPFYSMVSLRVGEDNYPLFYLLQQLSTFLGLLIIFIYVWLLPVESKIQPKRVIKFRFFWIGIAVLTLLITWIRFARLESLPDLGDLVVSVISAFFIALIAISLLIKIENQKII